MHALTHRVDIVKELTQLIGSGHTIPEVSPELVPAYGAVVILVDPTEQVTHDLQVHLINSPTQDRSVSEIFEDCSMQEYLLSG